MRKVHSDSFIACMVEAYLEYAAWSSLDEEGGSLDGGEWAPAARADALRECVRFMQDERVACAVEMTMLGPEAVGGDFWLTRERHGAGFWDRGLGLFGEMLTEVAHEAGTDEVYLGADGLLHFADEER